MRSITIQKSTMWGERICSVSQPDEWVIEEGDSTDLIQMAAI